MRLRGHRQSELGDAYRLDELSIGLTAGQRRLGTCSEEATMTDETRNSASLDRWRFLSLGSGAALGIAGASRVAGAAPSYVPSSIGTAVAAPLAQEKTRLRY